MRKDSLTRLHETKFEFRNKELFRKLCGVADSGINALEDLLDVRLVPRGHAFLVRAESEETLSFASAYFETLEKQYGGPGGLPEDFDTRYLYRRLKQRDEDSRKPEVVEDEPPPVVLKKETVFKTHQGKPIQARTERQIQYVQSLFDNDVTICLGPAGTGKTFLSVVAACRMFVAGDRDRLVLTRPAVEAGESLGYLPGDLTQKVDPYLRPLYDSLYECLGAERVHDLIQTRKIEIAPLAFMRGRTLNDSVIILDEAQNCTLSQLKMFLTRLGRNSTMCLSGDATQIDLPHGRSGLFDTVRALESIPGVGVIRFTGEDIIRHPLVERIVEAFDAMND